MLSKILLMALRPILASGIAWPTPVHTIQEPFPEQFSAVETLAPKLPKRDLPPSSICGYLSSYNSSVTCASTNYCGFMTAQSAFGCCRTYTYGVDNIYTLLDCFEPTTCYETSPIGPTDTSALYWRVGPTPLLLHSRATASKCMSFELSVPSQVYYALGCSNVSGLVQLQTTPAAQTTGTLTATGLTSRASKETTKQTSQQSQAQSQSASLSSNENGIGIGSGSVTSSLIPPTQTQKSAGSGSTTQGTSLSSSSAAAEGLNAPGWVVIIAIAAFGVLVSR